MKKEYTLGELTVVWQPHLCIHSGVCFRNLPHVFQPLNRPWIQLNEQDEEAIRDTVNACPSGAISLKRSSEEEEKSIGETQAWTQVYVQKNGPLRIREACRLTLPDGTVVEKPFGVSICRCGESADKPFCDGSHALNRFSG